MIYLFYSKPENKKELELSVLEYLKENGYCDCQNECTCTDNKAVYTNTIEENLILLHEYNNPYALPYTIFQEWGGRTVPFETTFCKDIYWNSFPLLNFHIVLYPEQNLTDEQIKYVGKSYGENLSEDTVIATCLELLFNSIKDNFKRKYEELIVFQI